MWTEMQEALSRNDTDLSSDEWCVGDAPQERCWDVSFADRLAGTMRYLLSRRATGRGVVHQKAKPDASFKTSGFTMSRRGRV